MRGERGRTALFFLEIYYQHPMSLSSVFPENKGKGLLSGAPVSICSVLVGLSRASLCRLFLFRKNSAYSIQRDELTVNDGSRVVIFM